MLSLFRFLSLSAPLFQLQVTTTQPFLTSTKLNYGRPKFTASTPPPSLLISIFQTPYQYTFDFVRNEVFI
jgi:hypothetical protein